MQRYQHILTAFMLSSALACFSGCGPTGKAAKLIGTWRLDAGGVATVTVTYSKDHTYMATMAGLRNGSESGEWRLEGDTLISKTKTSTIDKDDVGKEDPGKILKLDDSVLILQQTNRAGQEVAMTLLRVR